VLPNGQITDAATGLAETLEAVKDIYYSSGPYVGIACALKNAGVGVGLPDIGRVKLLVEKGKIHIYAGASDIGQGLTTVLLQIVSTAVGIGQKCVICHNPNTALAPDSGTTSGSRQTLITGEAARRAGKDLRQALFKIKGLNYVSTAKASGYLTGVTIETESTETAQVQFTGEDLNLLEGKVFKGNYLAATDKMGAIKSNPVSHVAYGYATQMCILNKDGTVKKIVAAHDVGKAINPVSVEGQIEGGVIMGCGYALTERYPLEKCVPTARMGTLGLMRADNAPEVESIIVEKPGVDVAYGAIGIGEITAIPTAPAIAGAYYKLMGKFPNSLPLQGTPYSKK
jgi:CO/xanthine dehydrogenase Mo-binding subunit